MFATGPDCEVQLAFNDTQCTVSPINPQLTHYNEWLSRRSEAISVLYPNYGMKYRWWATPELDPTKDQLKAALFTAIKDLHEEVGNVAIDGHRLIVGIGAHQVVAAAIHALSQDGPKYVMHKKPHWIRFGPISRYANTANATWWEDDETMIPSDWPERNIIEIVTHPNNPDNSYYEPAYEDSVKIYDLVYYWPNMQSKEKIIPVSEDIMVFSMSKLAPMPDVRIAWAWVKDDIIAERMATYISSTVQNVPGPAAFRTVKILNAIVNSKDDGPDEFFTFGNTRLRARYEQMKELVEGSDGKFSLVSDYGVFFMIKCDGCGGGNAENCCESALDSVGIKTRLGSRYGYDSSDGVVMTCIVDEDPNFEAFYKKFEQLANDQDFVFEQASDDDDDNNNNSQNEKDEDEEEKSDGDSGGVRGSSAHALTIITACATLGLI